MSYSRKYKIDYDKNIYNKIGGSKEPFNTIYNTVWPPQLNTEIWTKKKDDGQIWHGNVVEYIWNKTAAVVKIDNEKNNELYTDIALQDYERFNNGVGYLLLLPTFIWNYLEKKNYEINLEKNVSNVEDKLNPLVGKTKKKIIDKYSKFSNRLGLNEKEPKREKQEVTQIRKMQNIENSKYFNEQKIDVYLTDKDSEFKPLPDKYIEILQKKLKSFEDIDYINIIVNNSVAIDNLITKKEDISNEGSKISNWINESLKKDLFVDLNITIYNGYVYLTRTGLYSGDVITRSLVPSLHYFTWQEGIPIDYQTLKYIMFQNEYQKELFVNQNQKIEAEKIMSQENIIALQPKSEYQMWCVKKLLMIWYGDVDIQMNIRKIKILINQYRCDPDKDYNKKYGILPSIVIYPKYGRDNLIKVLSKIRYYFSMYVDDDTATPIEIFWNKSEPTYFLRDNNLIYHTNGSTDIKLYLEESAESNSKIVIDSFDNEMTKFKVDKTTY
jgi:hypothetical protein